MKNGRNNPDSRDAAPLNKQKCFRYHVLNHHFALILKQHVSQQFGLGMSFELMRKLTRLCFMFQTFAYFTVVSPHEAKNKRE